MDLELRIITPCSEKDEDCLMCLLKEAIGRVEDRYYHLPYNGVLAEYQRPERSFTSELYHQLRTIQRDNKCGIEEFTLHVEINKQRTNGNDWELKCGNDVIFKSRVVPDLVLHAAQNDRKYQGLICEVKTSLNITRLNFINDLEKLLIYTDKYLHFDYACFIFIGSKKQLEYELNRVNETRSNLIDCIRKKKIFFFTKEERQTNVYQIN